MKPGEPLLWKHLVQSLNAHGWQVREIASIDPEMVILAERWETKTEMELLQIAMTKTGLHFRDGGARILEIIPDPRTVSRNEKPERHLSKEKQPDSRWLVTINLSNGRSFQGFSVDMPDVGETVIVNDAAGQPEEFYFDEVTTRFENGLDYGLVTVTAIAYPK